MIPAVNTTYPGVEISQGTADFLDGVKSFDGVGLFSRILRQVAVPHVILFLIVFVVTLVWHTSRRLLRACVRKCILGCTLGRKDIGFTEKRRKHFVPAYSEGETPLSLLSGAVSRALTDATTVVLGSQSSRGSAAPKTQRSCRTRTRGAGGSSRQTPRARSGCRRSGLKTGRRTRSSTIVGRRCERGRSFVSAPCSRTEWTATLQWPTLLTERCDEIGPNATRKAI